MRTPTKFSRLGLWQVLLIILGTVPEAFPAESLPVSLVINGGFEADADGDGFPDDWKLSAVSEDTFVNGTRSPASRSGDFAFCLEKAAWRRGTNLSSTSRSRITPTLHSASFNLKPSTTYEISLWLRMEGPLPVDEVCFAIESNAKGFWGSRVFSVHVGREWKQHTVTVSTESDAFDGSLVFSRMGNWLDRLFIDDVSVTEAEDGDGVSPAKQIYRTDLSEFAFSSERPRVQNTAEEIETMAREWKSKGRELAAHRWLKEADPWLDRSLIFFDEGSKNAPRATYCPSCKAYLEPFVESKEVYGMECPKHDCGKRYTADDYLNRARERLVRGQAVGAILLGQAYVLTGDRRYADKGKQILLGFASRYHQWRGERGGNIMYPLVEGFFLYNCAVAFDYLHEALSDDERRKIENDFLRPAADFYMKKSDANGRMSNRGAIYNRALIGIGTAIGEVRYLDHVVNSPFSGFHALVAGVFDEDGLTYEGFQYQRFTMNGLCPIAETAFRAGINVYRDPGFQRIFEAPLYVLLPGEGRKMWDPMRDEYRVASRRFSEAGHQMEYPFGKDSVERASRLPSRNFEQRGYGVLRTGEGDDHIHMSMTYGDEAMWYGHCQNRPFSLVFYANGRTWTPRGYVGSGQYGHRLAGWSDTALANNTITVDDEDVWIGCGARPPACELIAFEVTPRVKVMRASDSHAWPQVKIDRTIFLADGYVIDFLGARGRRDSHRYDLCYRNFGKLSCDVPGEERDGPLGAGYGYEYVTGIRSARTDEAWQADWRDSEGRGLRISVLGAPETEVMTCTTPVNAYAGPYADAEQKDTVEGVVIRRRARETVVGVVWEPYRTEPTISKVVPLPVKGGDPADGTGIAVRKTGSKAAQYFLVSYVPGRKKFGGIELDGELAAGSWAARDAEPEYLQLMSGVLLKQGPRQIESSGPASIYVQRLPSKRLLIVTGKGGRGQLIVEGTLSSGAEVKAGGQRREAEINGKGSMIFPVAEGLSYELSGVSDWQRIRLEQAAGRMPEEASIGEVWPEDWEIQPERDIDAPRDSGGALTGTNKIANAGFEINPWTAGGAAVAGVASPWEQRHSFYSANFGKWYRAGTIGHDYDREEAHSGEYSVKITARNRSGATLRGRIEQKVDSAGANKTYTLSAWVKTNRSPTKVRLCLYGLDPDWGRNFEGGVSPIFEADKDWKRISWTRSFEPGITDVFAMVKREFQVAGGDLWIDDVQLEEGGEASAFVTDTWTKTAQSMGSGAYQK